MLHVDVAKVDRDVASVASVSEACCKHLFKMFNIFLDVCLKSVFYLDVAYVSHMLQEYVPMISAISVLCYSKCFNVCKLQVFDLDVVYVSHICFKCMFHIFYLLQTYVVFKCFMFQRCVQRFMGARLGRLGIRRGEPGADG